MVKNLPVVQEIQVQCLSQKDPWRREWLLRAKGKGGLTGAVIMRGEERCGIMYISLCYRYTQIYVYEAPLEDFK